MTNERDIGRLEAVAKSLEKQIDSLTEDISTLKSEIAEIKQLIATIKGGSKVIMFLGSVVGGGVGAAVLKFIIPIVAR